VGHKCGTNLPAEFPPEKVGCDVIWIQPYTGSQELLGEIPVSLDTLLIREFGGKFFDRYMGK
jgi:hypothetical protein